MLLDIRCNQGGLFDLCEFYFLWDGVRWFHRDDFNLPPPSKFGLPVLANFDESGYTVMAIPDKKGLRGFRIHDGDENATNFYLDSATGRVLLFDFVFQGQTFRTQNKKFSEFEGVLVATSFDQLIPNLQGAVIFEYRVDDTKINHPISAEVFHWRPFRWRAPSQ